MTSIIKKLTELGYPMALIKSFRGLPNVAEFRTNNIGIHEYAAIYGIEKVIREVTIRKLKVKFKPNEYLEYQMRRISILAMEGKVSRAWEIARILVTKSFCFRLLAMNRVNPTWFCLAPSKLNRQWRGLTSLCKRLSTDLCYKRVWIDKKPGDYGRPLGVPTMEWRMFSYMMLDVTERVIKAQGKMYSWQHGGRSGRGLMTAWEQLIPRLKAENIYEFDLKGFFDNITHESIEEAQKESMSNTFLEWYKRIITVRPKSYVLPTPDVEVPEPYRQAMREFLQNIYSEGPELEEMLEHFEKNPDQIMMNIYPERLDPEDPYTGRLIHDKPEDVSTRKWREKERDAWKGLGIEGKGVPQGLGISPFISTNTLEYFLNQRESLRNTLTMYMDDGVIISESAEEAERATQDLAEQLKKLGIEIAPEKSGWIKKEGVWTGREFRFLGLVYEPEKDMMRSKTRSGTEMYFPTGKEWHEVKALAEINGLEISGIRQRFDRMLNTKAHEAGLKYGFLGCLIAESQYKENPPKWVKQEMIREGYLRKLSEIRGKTSGYIWKFQDLYQVPTDLKYISSVAIANFTGRKGKVFSRRKHERRRHGTERWNYLLDRSVQTLNSSMGARNTRLFVNQQETKIRAEMSLREIIERSEEKRRRAAMAPMRQKILDLRARERMEVMGI